MTASPHTSVERVINFVRGRLGAGKPASAEAGAPTEPAATAPESDIDKVPHLHLSSTVAEAAADAEL